MALQVALHHKTLYRYDRPVQLGPHVVRLRPAPHCRTPIRSYSLKVVPAKHLVNWQQDPQSNYLARLVFLDSATELAVEVDLVAEMAVINRFDFFLEPQVENYPFTYDPQIACELCPYVEAEPAGPELASYLAEIPRETAGTMEFLVGLNRRLQRDIGYGHRLEPGVQTCEETLARRMGSCRDSAWLFIQIARHLGLAARFVSGYLIQLESETGDPAADGAALHAWAEVYLPGAGWVGFDPRSGLLAAEGHIPLAGTSAAVSAAPISGRVSPCETEFHHDMTVERISE
jgi:transglutaminase-like putative cysteine protease